MQNRLRQLSLLCTALVALTAIPGAGAQSAEADAKEIGAYRLTMDALMKVARVNRAIYEQMQKDPAVQEQMKLKSELKTLQSKEETSEAENKRIEEIQQRLEALEEKHSGSSNDMSSAKTLSEMARAAERTPILANALKREGMTAREYSTFMLASMQAGMTAGLMNSKLGIDRSKLTEAQLANAKFIQEHQAELERLQPTEKPE